MATSKTSTTKKGSTSQQASSSQTGSAAQKARARVMDGGLTKGKALAAAGVAAAAAAAGVAYLRTGRGRGDNGRSVFHVLPAEEGWQVKGDGAERAASRHATKDEALAAARELVRGKAPSQLVVHKSDGSVQRRWSYDS